MPSLLNTITLKKSCIYSLLIVIILIVDQPLLFAQKREQKGKSPQVIIALNAYSFNDLLVAKDSRDKQNLYTLFNMMDWAADHHIKGVDLTGYYFPGYPDVPSDEYIERIKAKAKERGLVITGTGIRNNFANPDPVARAADVELAKKWIVVAAKLGAPVLRLFAGEIPKGYEDKWDEVAGWMIESYKQCAVVAEQNGVKIGIQNHGDMLKTAEQCMKVLKGVNSPWAGLIIDTGNFITPDPYNDIEALVPYAVNWQVKESALGMQSTVRTDFVRLMQILKRTGYNGYLPVETLLVRGRPYDPFALVPQLIIDLEIARDQVYKK